uniref:Secreted protein n=1 Tax=Ditylenchus dipsaci TaxID=166011 RepID=A0A915DYH6_9BILA
MLLACLHKQKLVDVLLLWMLLHFVEGQFNSDCSDAPNEALRRVCLVLRQIDQASRTRADNQAQQQQSNQVQEVWPPAIPGAPVWQQPTPVPFNARGQTATHPYDCMTLQCLCPSFRPLKFEKIDVEHNGGNSLEDIREECPETAIVIFHLVLH